MDIITYIQVLVAFVYTDVTVLALATPLALTTAKAVGISTVLTGK